MELSINLFLILLFVTSALTALFTEGAKVLLNGQIYSANLLAAVVSIVVTSFFSVGYCVLNKVVVDSSVIVFFIALVAFSWLVSMLGYDKVKQCISQIIAYKTEKLNKFEKFNNIR